MRKICSFIVAATMMVSPALAGPDDQPETGSRLAKSTRPGPQLSPEQANRAAQALANCLVSKRGASATTYLLSRDGKGAQSMDWTLRRDVGCLNIGPEMGDMSNTRVVTIPTDLFRGKLAEALLRADAKSIETLPAIALQKQYIRPWYPITTRHTYIDEMAICVAETNPRGINTMLMARPDSSEEVVAFKALIPSLPPCLRAGANLTANRQALRAALAEGLWQRIHAPAAEQVNPPEEKAK